MNGTYLSRNPRHCVYGLHIICKNDFNLFKKTSTRVYSVSCCGCEPLTLNVSVPSCLSEKMVFNDRSNDQV